MVKLFSGVGRNSSRYLLIAAMTSFLVACGGGGSGDTSGPFPDLDSDNDGTINSEDDDDDGDLILDVEDNFIDRDGDGFDDVSGLTEAEANPPIEPVVPGDNDGDGFVDVTDATPCGSESGTDNNSSNNAWNDNCTVERSTIGGQFADSLFAVGIQRVVYCEGFGAGASYTNFADGEFGPGSETALIDFQRREALADPSLADDGRVGPATWAVLQAQLDLLDAGTIDGVNGGRDTYGFSEGRCAGIPMFYQQTQFAEDGLAVERLGWSLARNQPNQVETLPFSIGSPFIDL
ncbi:MAG: peptidoglycan-binding protein [Granulosicoccus sp.]